MSLIYYRIHIILHDICAVAIAWTLSFVIRYDLPLVPDVKIIFLQVLPIVVIIQSIILYYSGLYKAVWRFTSLPDLVAILRTVFIGVLATVLILVLSNHLNSISQPSLIFYPFLLTFLLGMPRLLYRLWYEHSFKFLLNNKIDYKRVLIIGAGRSGDILVRDMLRNYKCGYMPIGFLDDQPRLNGGKLQGVPILGSINALAEIINPLTIDLIVIAIPSATDEQMRLIVEQCKTGASHIPVRTLPKLDELVRQQVDLHALHDVAIEDLLGRDKVQLDWQIIKAGLRKKVVMVSGGGGSIGSELCYQIAQLNPTSLVIIERCEFSLYQVEMRLRQAFPNLVLHTLLGDIVDKVAMRYVLKSYQPDVIFHTAAFKHVPMLQSQIREAVRNNVIGTHILAKLAVEQGCQTFVLISTDKAVNPTSIMGATKRAAEIICQAINEHSYTRFITVRFGNVLGSAGSVIPLFKEQIAKGGPITVTHTDISRYFMTIPEACQLILQAGVMGQGGEIFVLDMGDPVKIKYLAEQMVQLTGKTPYKDIKIIYTGLRPGEKLYEELFYIDEKLAKTTHTKILLADHHSGSNKVNINNIMLELKLA